MPPWFTTLPFVYLIHWRFKEGYHAARFEKDRRYYMIALSKDLLGDWVLVLINGRIKSKLGQSRTLAFRNFNEAFDHFCLLAKVRHQRRYQLKTVACDNQLRLHLLAFLIHSRYKEEGVVLRNINCIHKQGTPTKIANLPVNLEANKTTKQLNFVF